MEKKFYYHRRGGSTAALPADDLADYLATKVDQMITITYRYLNGILENYSHTS